MWLHDAPHDIHYCPSSCRFISILQHSMQYSMECIIMAFVYINRICGNESSRIALTGSNWSMLWITSVLLAQKYWDDIPLKISHFTDILPSITRAHLHSLELRAFALLDFSLAVPTLVYVKVYFELREVYGQMMGGLWRQLPARPLSPRDTRAHEQRSTLATRQHHRPHRGEHRCVEAHSGVFDGEGASSPHTAGRKHAAARSKTDTGDQRGRRGGHGGRGGEEGRIALHHTLEDTIPLCDKSRYVLS